MLYMALVSYFVPFQLRAGGILEAVSMASSQLDRSLAFRYHFGSGTRVSMEGKMEKTTAEYSCISEGRVGLVSLKNDIHNVVGNSISVVLYRPLIVIIRFAHKGFVDLLDSIIAT